MSIYNSLKSLSKWKIVAYLTILGIYAYEIVKSTDLLKWFPQEGDIPLEFFIILHIVLFSIMATLFVHMHIFFTRTERNNRAMDRRRILFLFLYILNLLPLFASLYALTTISGRGGLLYEIGCIFTTQNCQGMSLELAMGCIFTPICLGFMSILALRIHPKDYLICGFFTLILGFILFCINYVGLPQPVWGGERNLEINFGQRLFFLSSLLSIVVGILLISANLLLKRQGNSNSVKL